MRQRSLYELLTHFLLFKQYVTCFSSSAAASTII